MHPQVFPNVAFVVPNLGGCDRGDLACVLRASGNPIGYPLQAFAGGALPIGGQSERGPTTARRQRPGQSPQIARFSCKGMA